MAPSSETLYQIVRILFALSLLGFLFLVIRITLRELQQQPLVYRAPGRSSVPRAELLTVAGEEGSTVSEGQIFELQGAATIGRASSSRIILDDSSVSAQHAIVRSGDSGWVIEDLGSRNGTLVNGRVVDKPAALSCGDAIQLGRVRLRLMC